jgi:hypothetical protein
MIVIGVGSGRTGTASLSRLINSQDGAICFHELNPTGVVFEGNRQPIINTINEFQAILSGGDKHLLSLDYSRPASLQTYQSLKSATQIRILGDIAYYYLKYVDDILAINQSIRFVCIKRDKRETVDSWIEKSRINRWMSLWLADRLKSLLTRTPFHQSKNFWQEHDGSYYQLDPIWDKTFPKFQANTKREAIEHYWDYYYQEAERLALLHPKHFRIFDIGEMSHPDGQKRILDFIGIPEDRMVLRDKFHEHQSGRHS